MTNEEAIYALGVAEHMESFSVVYDPGERMNHTTVRELKEACRVAVTALRAQQTPAKLDRSRWEECSDCWVWERSRKFCPDCGRPLTEEAWAELERRIGGNDGTTDN